jgi:tetratricopeptide (TPR) repeat protein
MGEARMYAHGWTVSVIREGMQALAAEEGLDASGLRDDDVWRWLRGEAFPGDSLRRLCRLFRCHPAQLGWPQSLEALDRQQQLMEECWGLCDTGDTHTAERVVRGFLPAVARSAGDRGGAAILTARGLRLMGLIRQHQLRIRDKVSYCQQAVEYARQSGDATTLVGALIDLAVGFRYAGQPANDFAMHNEALQHVERATPLTRSRAYAAIAAAFAQRSQSAEAAKYIRRAYQAFPADPQSDPHWLSSDAGIWYVSFHEGRALTALGRPAEAERAFESYKQHSTARAVPERVRLEIENERARAAALAGDLELYASRLRSGLKGSLALGSRKRYHEALSIYQLNTPPHWRRQPLMAQVTEEIGLGSPPWGS